MDNDAAPLVLDPIEKLTEEYLKRIRRGEHPARRIRQFIARACRADPRALTRARAAGGLKPTRGSRRFVGRQ